MNTQLKPIDRAEEVRLLLLAGAITYDEAKTRVKPILAEMDVIARGIAKKFGKRHRPFSVISFFR